MEELGKVVHLYVWRCFCDIVCILLVINSVVDVCMCVCVCVCVCVCRHQDGCSKRSQKPPFHVEVSPSFVSGQYPDAKRTRCAHAVVCLQRQVSLLEQAGRTRTNKSIVQHTAWPLTLTAAETIIHHGHPIPTASISSSTPNSLEHHNMIA